MTGSMLARLIPCTPHSGHHNIAVLLIPPLSPCRQLPLSRKGWQDNHHDVILCYCVAGTRTFSVKVGPVVSWDQNYRGANITLPGLTNTPFSCPRGQVSNTNGTLCSCAAGYTRTSPTDAECIPCPNGYFKAEMGESQCEACPDKFASMDTDNMQGSTSIMARLIPIPLEMLSQFS